MALVNALTSTGFGIAALATTMPSENGAAKVLAMYAAARTFPLAVAVAVLVAMRSTRSLFTLAILLGAIQACDAVVGIAQHDVGKTLGPAVFAVATLASARFLRGRERARPAAS